MTSEEMRHLSQLVDSSLDMPSIFGSSGDPSATDWEVQSPEAIIQEVKQRVHERKPWRHELDESVLERRRQNERQGRLERGYHIILPDNRVRAMEDQLSKRVRAQLLGESVPETTPAPAPSHTRR